MGGGWIKLERQIMNHWLYRERRHFSKYEAWIDLKMKVNYMDNQILFDGMLTDVPRGSMLTSLRQLADTWRWSITKVKNFLKLLESENMIRLEIDTKKTVISIVAYDLAEDAKDTEVTEKEQQKDSEKTLKETNKNVKNLKKLKIVKKEKKYPKRSLGFTFENLDMQLATVFFEKMLQNNPAYQKPDMDMWAQEMYHMRTRDERTEEQIRFLIDWTQAHRFWKTRILSPNQLRKQFGKLFRQVKQDQEAKRRAIVSTQPFAYHDNG